MTAPAVDVAELRDMHRRLLDLLCDHIEISRRLIELAPMPPALTLYVNPGPVRPSRRRPPRLRPVGR